MTPPPISKISKTTSPNFKTTKICVIAFDPKTVSGFYN